MFDSDSPWEFRIADPLRKLSSQNEQGWISVPCGHAAFAGNFPGGWGQTLPQHRSPSRASHTGSQAAVGLWLLHRAAYIISVDFVFLRFFISWTFLPGSENLRALKKQRAVFLSHRPWQHWPGNASLCGARVLAAWLLRSFFWHVWVVMTPCVLMPGRQEATGQGEMAFPSAWLISSWEWLWRCPTALLWQIVHVFWG